MQHAEKEPTPPTSDETLLDSLHQERKQDDVTGAQIVTTPNIPLSGQSSQPAPLGSDKNSDLRSDVPIPDEASSPYGPSELRRMRDGLSDDKTSQDEKNDMLNSAPTPAGEIPQ